MNIIVIFGLTGALILGIYALMGTFGMQGKGQLLQVKLSTERLQSAEVKAIYRDYLNAYHKLMLILAGVLLGLLVLPMPWVALKIMAVMVWIFVSAVLPIRVYDTHRKRLKQWNRERDIEAGAVSGFHRAHHMRYADLLSAKSRGSQTLGWQWFLPLVVLVVALMLYDLRNGNEWAVVFTFYSTSLIIVLSSGWMSKHYGRLRNPVISEDSEVNQLYATAFKRRWSLAYWFGAVLACLSSVGIWVLSAATTDEVIWVEGTLILLVALVGGEVLCLLWTAYDLKRMKERLSSPNVQEMLAEEDDFWIWGTLYNNPNDTSKYVPKRFGIGLTPNFAHKGNRILYGGILASALLVLVLALGGALVSEIAEPGIDLSNPETISFKALVYGRTFNQSELISVERIPVSSIELIYKTNGLWSGNRAIGYFRAAGHEEVLLYANLKAEEYIKLEFKDITVFCTLSDEKATDVAYAELLQRLGR